MKLVRVGAAVLNQTPLDWESNTRNILEVIEEARRRGVTVLCLPELCVTGYGCEDLFHTPYVYDMTWDILTQTIAPHTRGMIVSVGAPVRYDNNYYNTAALLVDGEVRGFTAKQFLAGDGIHYEPRWFKPWPEDVVATLEVDGKKYPFGDVYFDVGGIRIGFEICEDAWVAHRPGSDLALKGVDIILNPSASHFAFGKLGVRKGFVIEGARAFGVTYVYSNLLGNEAGRSIYDGGALIASSGRLLRAGPRFSYADWQLVDVVVDVERTRVNRARTVSHRPQVAMERHDCASVAFEYPRIDARFDEPEEAALWEQSTTLKEEEFTRAVSLALFDYLRKSRARGFVVSLSGGADSSAVACLVALAMKLGTRELGLDGVKEKLAHIPGLDETSSSEELVNRLLTCVYQSTRNSSETTRHAARTLAEALSADYLELDVDSLVQGYTQMIEQAVGRELSWDRDDIALQNIQARVRAPSVWMLANMRSALLLATSNRSEAAVGYATMDGDTAGGLSPIAGIDKAFLRGWLRWLETTGPTGDAAIPALSAVTAQQPTAELRPPDADQTDEGDLMPYPLLDRIERAAIRDKMSPAECLRLLEASYPQYEADQLEIWTRRFFTLFARNQWKRERYAPSFHVDDESLDPKTWYRFPILSGGFRMELEALDTDK